MAVVKNDITSNKLAGESIVLKKGQTITPEMHAATKDEGTMRTYLLTNGYTEKQLFNMTKNDLVFAYRSKVGLR